ncbi:MAG TPA: branched-chain amino acid ABC transporter permease, partial [Acidimicrobiales bacterium]|nr:branched-chain amino acid ABC transporter permease [Acidimicrobiales bacterium]
MTRLQEELTDAEQTKVVPRVSRLRNRNEGPAISLPFGKGGLWAPLAVAAVGLVALPFLSSFLKYIFAIALAYGVAATGVGIAFSSVGMLVAYQSATMLTGCYMALWALSSGWTFWGALVLGLMGGIVLSLIMAIATLALNDFAFAVLGFSFAFLAQNLVESPTMASWSGGDVGRTLPISSVFGLKMNVPQNAYVVNLIVACAVLVVLAIVVRSSFGRAAVNVRFNPFAASLIGIPVPLMRVGWVALAGGLGGLGGALASMSQSYVAPNTYDPVLGVIMVALALAGGYRHLAGAILGSAVLWGTTQSLQMSQTNRDILVGFILLVVLVFARDGLLGAACSFLRWTVGKHRSEDLSVDGKLGG